MADYNLSLPENGYTVPYSGPYSPTAYDTVNTQYNSGMTGDKWYSTMDWSGVGTGLGGLFSGIGNLVAGTKGTQNTGLQPRTGVPTQEPPTDNKKTFLIIGFVIVGVIVFGAIIYFITNKKGAA